MTQRRRQSRRLLGRCGLNKVREYVINEIEASKVEIERPRSYSLPNLGFNPEMEEYQYNVERDFRAEIQQYFIEKNQAEKRQAQEQTQLKGE